MKKRASWITLYTSMFAVAAVAVILTCTAYGKSLIWSGDTYEQEYTVLLYLKRWFASLLSGNGIRLVDLTLGQGLDVPTTLTYYGFTDPFALLSLLFSDEAMSIAYIVIAFARLYTAGLLLGVYMKILGVNDKYALCCGCMVYTFCGFNLRMLGRFSYFINGGLYLILLLIAIERLLRRDKWLIYVLAAAVGIYVNFYFAFMNTICAIVYICVRLVPEIRNTGVKPAARKGFMLLVGYILGIMLSCCLLIPVVKLYLSNGRMGVECGYSGNMLHYPLKYYFKFIYQFFSSYDSAGYNSMLSYAAPALSACIALLFTKQQQLLVAIVLCIVGLSVPAFGYFMNGGSYVTNRWVYTLSVFMGCVCAAGIQNIYKNHRITAYLTAAFAVMLLAASLIIYRKISWSALIMLACAVFLIYLKASCIRQALTALVLISCVLNSILTYASFGWNIQEELLDTDVYGYMLNQTPAREINDDSLHRIDTYASCDSHSSTFGYMGTGFFWSLIDKRTTSFMSQIGSTKQSTLYRMCGISSNVYASEIAAVKYHISQSGTGDVIPYGYSFCGTTGCADGQLWDIYENNYALPLGYAFKNTLSYDKWQSLSAADKIYALTAYAITPDGGDEFESGVCQLPLISSDINNNMIEGSAGTQFTLTFETTGDSQIYLVFDGIKLDKTDTVQARRYVTVTSAAGNQTMSFAPKSYNYYFPNETQVLYIGSGENVNWCTLTLDTDMRLNCASVNVYAIPNASYTASVNDLLESSLTNITAGTNSLSGAITLSEDRVLQIAVPYSEGWTAWVDGDKASLTECGGMYMGLKLESGNHTIELRYFTPGLKTGLAVSVAAAVIIAALLIISSKSKKARKQS